MSEFEPMNGRIQARLMRWSRGLTVAAAASLCALSWLAGAEPAPVVAGTDGAPSLMRLTEARVVVSDADAPAQLPATATWQPQALPDDWAVSRRDFGGSLWYELRFNAAAMGAQDVGNAIYVERACSNVEIFLNGTAIGNGGRMRYPYARNCATPLLFTIPHGALRPGDNVLHLHVVGYPLRQLATSQRASGLSVVTLGPLDALRAVHAEAQWWRVSLPHGAAIVLLVFSALFAALWLLRRNDAYYGWFALWTGWWGANATRLLWTDPPWSQSSIEMVVLASSPVVVSAMVLFKTRYTGARPRWLNRLLLLQVVLIPVLIVALGTDGVHAIARGYYAYCVLQVCATALWFARWAWRHSRLDFWFFCGGDFLLVTISLFEYAAAYLGYPMKAQLSPIAGLLTLLPASLRLLWLLAESLSRTEALNQTLEARVAEKSSEIERNYAELAALRERDATLNERRRIAADLHDDLGAKLLTIAQTAPPERADVAGLAREALEEMRLSVRGMVGETQSIAHAVADWRVEAVTRLAQANIAVHWQVIPEASSGSLPARTQVQLTRILRESVSNVIRHSGARRCEVELRIDATSLTLQVDDDGAGIPPGAQRSSHGTGLANIERRTRKLGGKFDLSQRDGGGTRVWVTVPVADADKFD